MEEIKDILQIFAKQVRQILGSSLVKTIVYGSYARGDYRENSDVDVMILTRLPEDEIKKYENLIYDAAFEIQMRYFVDISVIIKNLEQYEYWLETVPFYRNVQKEGVMIDG